MAWLFPLTRRCQTSMDSASERLSAANKNQKTNGLLRRHIHIFNVVLSLPECCVNILIPGSGTLTAAVLPGGVPVLLPGSRGLLPAPLPRLPFPWCGWDAWGCGGWSPVDVPSPTRPTCCPIPVVWRKDVWDEASNPLRTSCSHSPTWRGLARVVFLNPLPALLHRANVN